MVSHSDRHSHYTTDHDKVKLLSPGLGRDDGQRLRCRLLRATRVCYADRAMVSYEWHCFARQSGGSVIYDGYRGVGGDGVVTGGDSWHVNSTLGPACAALSWGTATSCRTRALLDRIRQR